MRCYYSIVNSLIPCYVSELLGQEKEMGVAMQINLVIYPRRLISDTAARSGTVGQYKYIFSYVLHHYVELHN